MRKSFSILIVLLALMPGISEAGVMITHKLTIGSKGTEVVALQQFLREQGYFTYPSNTGFYGRFTWNAVAALQKDHGLEPVGFVGPRTRSLLANAGGPVSSTPQSSEAPSPLIPPPNTALSNGYVPGFGGGGAVSVVSSDTTSPSISGISSGTPGQTSVTISWTTNEPATSQVEYGATTSYASSTSLDSSLVTSHSVVISSLSASTTYHFRVRSADAAGNTATSSDQTFVTAIAPDTTVPTVSMTAPANNSTVYGSSITLSANASDDVAVAGVTFKINGVTIGSEDTSAPYSTTWDSTATTSGTKTIVAVARDTSNNYATSSAISVTNMHVASTGALIGILGDSINEYEFNSGPTQTLRLTGLQIYTAGIGEVGDALAYDPRASLLAWNDVTDNIGLLTNTPRYYSGGDVAKAGASLLDIYNEISRLTAYNPDIVIIGGGTNSLGLSNSAFTASSTAIWDAVHSALPNAIIGVENVRPVAVSASTTGSRNTTNIQSKNAALATALASRPWADLIDVFTQFNDDSSNPGYGLSTDYGDGLHPSIVGAQKGSVPIVSFLQSHITSGNAITARKIASVLPTGYALNTGSHSITHVSGNGGGISGTAPTWADVALVGNPVSSTTVSLESNSETGGQSVVFTVTPNGATTTIEQFVIRPTGINFATTSLQSQWVRMWAELECDQGPWIQTTLNNAERANSTANLQQTIVGLAPQGSGTRRIYPITPSLQFQATSTGAVPSITVKFNPSAASSPFTCKLRQWDMQTESSPVRP